MCVSLFLLFFAIFGLLHVRHENAYFAFYGSRKKILFLFLNLYNFYYGPVEFNFRRVLPTLTK